MATTLYKPEYVERAREMCLAGAINPELAADDGYPCRRTVTRWAVRDTEGFADRYAAARRAGVESRIEDANEIAAETPLITMMLPDGTIKTCIDAAGIQRNRLRCDQAKWEASHLLRGGIKSSAPLDYGDKIQTEISGELNLSLADRLQKARDRAKSK
jgi:hypothetical protein